MHDTESSRWDRPVFVASMGRSGSTLLQRLLNVHPELTIWGEHGGFLKGLLDSYSITQEDAVRENLQNGFDIRSSVIGELEEKNKFKPWVSPFRSEDLADGIRDLMIELFTRGLPPEVRWGFKEIRYSSEELGALMDLFPDGRLIILARDLEGYAMSRFFAFGNTDYDLESESGRAHAEKKLAQISRGWIQRYQALLELRAGMQARTSIVAYSDLVPGSDRPQQLFAELGERPASDDAIEVVLGAKTGSSFRFNEAARINREVLTEIFTGLDYDREEYGRLSSELGLS